MIFTSDDIRVAAGLLIVFAGGILSAVSVYMIFDTDSSVASRRNKR